MSVGSIGSVGGSNSAEIAQLQRQLQKDMQALAKDTQNKSAAETLALDAAKIAADQAALAAAENKQTAGQTLTGKPGQAEADAVQTSQAQLRNGAAWIGGIDVYA